LKLRFKVLCKAKADLAVKQEITAASESAAEASSATAARCPNIHKAVGALETALHDMEIAKNDFCGHKAEAMEATRHALEQLKKAALLPGTYHLGPNRTFIMISYL